MSDKKSSRIPADELSAYERWELPAMQATGNDVLRSRVTSAEMPVKPLTAADLEAIREEAYQAGFEQGKVDGREAGHQEGFDQGTQEGIQSGTQQGIEEGKLAGKLEKQAEVDQTINRLNSVMEELLEPIRLHKDETEEALLNLVLAISRAVIVRELSIDSQQVAAVITDALALLPPSATNVKIKINPADFDVVSEVVASIAVDSQVIKTDEILPGGCKVETLQSQVDSTIEKRFQKTVQQMLDRHTSSLPIEETPDLADAMGEMTDFHRDVLEAPTEVEPTLTPNLTAESVNQTVESVAADEELPDTPVEDAASTGPQELSELSPSSDSPIESTQPELTEHIDVGDRPEDDPASISTSPVPEALEVGAIEDNTANVAESDAGESDAGESDAGDGERRTADDEIEASDGLTNDAP